MSSQKLDQPSQKNQSNHTFLPSEPESISQTHQPNQRNQNSDFQTGSIDPTSPNQDQDQAFYQNNPQSFSQKHPSQSNLNPVRKRGSRGFSFDIKKLAIYSVLILVLLASLFVKHPLGLLVFWVSSLLTIKLRSELAWIVVLICLLFILITFPVSNYLTLAGLVLTLFSALFLGSRPSLSKFNKYIIGVLALILGLWVTVPMSQIGTLKYIQTEYTQNSLFQNIVNSLYIGAGSPKLSPAEIEKSFKVQISSEIAAAVKDKTKLLPSDTAKVAELCSQLGVEQDQSEICKNLDRKNLDKSVDQAVSNQVDKQTQDLKNQFYKYPQVQMVQNFLGNLVKSDNATLSSPYFIPGILLFLIYAFVAGLLQLISWPILILFKRISLS